MDASNPSLDLSCHLTKWQEAIECPVTCTPMEKPVILPCCKQLIDQVNLTSWKTKAQQKNITPLCPMCRAPLQDESQRSALEGIIKSGNEICAEFAKLKEANAQFVARLKEKEAEIARKDAELSQQGAKLAQVRHQRNTEYQRRRKLETEIAQKNAALSQQGAEFAQLKHQQEAGFAQLRYQLETEIVRKDAELRQQQAELAQLKGQQEADLAWLKLQQEAVIARKDDKLREQEAELAYLGRQQKEFQIRKALMYPKKESADGRSHGFSQDRARKRKEEDR